MTSVLDDEGALQVVLEDYEKHKLPRIQHIRDRVDKGERLDDYDMKFLKDMYREIHQYESFVEEHPGYLRLYKSFVQIYCHIMDAALENERQSNG